MNFINLFISHDYSIKVKNNNLVLEGEESHDYPLEDIGVVMIESLKSVISTSALLRLSENGATVFICNDKHLPTVQLLPCNDYYKPLRRIKLQQSLSKPRQKNLWKEIIKRKIKNQADCLEKAKGDGGKLNIIAENIKSGDTDNGEAVASAYYFPKLFGSGFTRDNDETINSALNYAYAIVRGIIARQISARGLLPCIGIFHKNEYNAFNLADDLIEPFRPIVDYFVYSLGPALLGDLSPNLKKALFSVVNLEVWSGEERHSLSYAVEREIESVIAYYEGKDELVFPRLIGTYQHRYE